MEQKRKSRNRPTQIQSIFDKGETEQKKIAVLTNGGVTIGIHVWLKKDPF